MNFEVPSSRLTRIFQTYESRTRAQEIDYIQRTFEDELCLLEGLQSCKHIGISNDSLALRQQVYGQNSQPETPGPTFCKLYLAAYRDYPIKLLILLALLLIAVTAVVRLQRGVDWGEGLSILIAVQLSILVSVLNNLYKVHIFKKLTRNYEQLQRVTVVRGGAEMLVHPEDLVVGDICLVATHEILPCDGLLLEEVHTIHPPKDLNFFESSRFSSHADLHEYNGLIVDETIFGRNEAAKKNSLSICQKEAELSVQGCSKMAVPSPVMMAGTTIIKGSGRMLVLAVGVHCSRSRTNLPSEICLKQSTMLPSTPLQTDLISLSSKLSLYGKIMTATLVIVMFVRFLLEKLGSQQWNLENDLSRSFEIVLLGSCILVLSVPEGLPLSVTISIAYSLESIYTDGSLVRNIEACQTIGLVTDLCIDKEGLLVEDRIKANSLFSFEMEGMLEVEAGSTVGIPKGSREFKEKLGLCLMNKVCLDQSHWVRIEEAFREMALHYKIRPHPVLSRHSVEQSRSVICIKYIMLNNKKINVLKGLSTKLLEFCKYVFDEGMVKDMSSTYREDIMLATQKIQLKGETAMLLGYNEGSGIVFLALVGIQEEIKPNIKENFEKLESSGIHSYILMKQGKDLSEAFINKTGLNHSSLRTFMDAKQFYATIGGLVCKSCRVNFCDCPYDAVLAQNMEVDPKIDAIANKQAFSKIIDQLAGFYNCGPREKYALIVGLRDIGRIVAVTSNSYQDKLTLCSSDVGFVSHGSSYKHDLGQIGGINMLESNLEVITRSILWGRNVISSVQKFLVVHLTANIVAISLTLYGGLVWQEGILRPVQLLWINILIDNLAAMALATEPRREHLSDKPTQYRLINSRMVIKVVVLVLYQLLVLMLIYNFGERFLPEFPDAFDTYLKAGKRDPFLNKYNSETKPRLFVRSGRSFTIDGQPDYLAIYRDIFTESRHLTLVFNVFVLLQIFNFISCRKVHRGKTWMESLKKNGTFLGVLFAVLISQYFIVTFGGMPLRVYSYGLDSRQWLICIAFGLVQLVITGLLSLGEESVNQPPTSLEIVDYRNKSSKIKPRRHDCLNHRRSIIIPI